MAQPKVSIITATMNSERFLEDTIQGIVRQEYPNLEYIVIDGGSTDNTLKIIESHRSVISKWISEPDHGIYDAFNKGIARSSGELIGIINSDDYYAADTVKTVVAMYGDDPSYDVYHGKVGMIDADNTVKAIQQPNRKYDRIWHKMIFRHPTCFVKRDSYERFGFFDPRFRISADYEFFLRLYKMGARFNYIDQVLAFMREGGISSLQRKESWRECRQIAIEHGLSRVRAYFDYYYKLLGI